MKAPEDFAAARSRMVRRQLKRRGVQSPRVLAAMESTPRERFVPAGSQGEAYADRALPIDCGQTISQPYIVALMTEALELGGTERVLEIGTGGGYQTAVLAQLAGEVFSIERHEELSRQAAERLKGLGFENVRLKVGDGAEGWPAEAPFDRILITAAAERCPPALWEQLAEGGLLVGPFGPEESQILRVLRKTAGQKETTALTACRFVPLVTARPQR